jgi:hypothetical protein
MSDALESLPAAMQQKVRAELGKNEKVLWAGKPVAGQAFSYSWRFFLPTLAIWYVWVALIVLFAFFLPEGAPRLGAGVLAAILAVIGLVFAWLNVTRVGYVLTDRRVMVLRGLLQNKMRIFTDIDTSEIEKKPLKDGVGNLVWAREETELESEGRDPQRVTRVLQFVAIRDVDRVEKLMRQVFSPRATRQATPETGVPARPGFKRKAKN